MDFALQHVPLISPAQTFGGDERPQANNCDTNGGIVR
jgi:hypothetical protein